MEKARSLNNLNYALKAKIGFENDWDLEQGISDDINGFNGDLNGYSNGFSEDGTGAGIGDEDFNNMNMD